MAEPKKTCKRCGKAKRISMFHVNNHMKDGFHSVCKVCRKKKAKPVTRKWTPEEDAIIRQYAMSETYEKVAERLNRSFFATKQRAIRLGFRKQAKHTATTTAQLRRMVELHNQGLSAHKIAKEVGRTTTMVCRHLAKLGYDLRTNWTADEDSILREMVEQGQDFGSIASMLGRTECAARKRAEFIGVQVKYVWNEAEKQFLIDNYKRMSHEEMGYHLSRTKNSVAVMCASLGLIKQPRWTESEIELLRKHYPDGDIDALAGLLGRKARSIHNKAEHLGIRRSEARMQAVYAERAERLRKLASNRKGKKSAKPKTSPQPCKRLSINPFMMGVA